MEQFVKENTKKHYISEKPKRQQLYFLYKLIMNRTIGLSSGALVYSDAV